MLNSSFLFFLSKKKKRLNSSFKLFIKNKFDILKFCLILGGLPQLGYYPKKKRAKSSINILLQV